MPFTIGLDTLLSKNNNYAEMKIDAYDTLPLKKNIDFS